MCMQLEVEHLLTLHMRSRKFPSKAAHAEVNRILAALADLAFGRTATWAIESEVPPWLCSPPVC